MNNDRQLIRGKSPWNESTRFINNGSDFDDVGESPEETANSTTVEEVEVVLVFARPRSSNNRAFWEDHSAEIVTGDVLEEYTMTPFERTQAEYHGYDRRGTPTTDLFDDDPSKFFS